MASDVRVPTPMHAPRVHPEHAPNRYYGSGGPWRTAPGTVHVFNVKAKIADLELSW